MKFTIKLLLIFSIITSCDNSSKNPDITIVDKSIDSIIDSEAKIEILVDSLLVSEGPLWDKLNNSLIFTDVAQNKIFKWNSEDGINEYIKPSGYTGYSPAFKDGLSGANGAAFDGTGNLILCQHGDRRLVAVKNEKTESPNFITLVDNYEGKKFNSPNDLAINSSGDIYFTDPPYGFFNLATQTFNNKYKELDFNGVYKLNTKGELSLISKEVSIPNGIALSLDEKYIYVNNSDGESPVIMKFDLSNNSGELFFDGTELSKIYEGGFDGLKVHSSGNIFSTGPNGILIISPSGKLLGTINFGGGVTNCNFDSNEEYLYVTAFSYVARIKLKTVNKQFAFDQNKPIIEVEASCGLCMFNMEGDECFLAIRHEGKSFPIDGTGIDDHGDAHSNNGFCNAIRKAEVQGKLVNGIYLVNYFKLSGIIPKG